MSKGLDLGEKSSRIKLGVINLAKIGHAGQVPRWRVADFARDSPTYLMSHDRSVSFNRYLPIRRTENDLEF